MLDTKVTREICFKCGTSFMLEWGYPGKPPFPTCKQCKCSCGGDFIETSLMDGLKGILHCYNCNSPAKILKKTGE